MAIPFLSDIKLNGNQIKELVVDHKSSSQPTSGYHGQLIFRTDENKIYINTSTNFNSPSWSSIAGDITSITAGNGLTGDATTGDVTLAVGASKGISVGADKVSVDPDDVTLNFTNSSDSAKLQLKEIANNRILGNVSGDSEVPTALTKANVLSMINVADGAQVNVGTNITVTENNTTVTIASSTGSNDTIQAATTSKAGVMTKDDKSKLDNIEATADVTDTTNVLTALSGNLGSATFGDSNDTITIPGNLKVTGDTTYSNETIQIVEDNKLAFRAGDGNAHEILLTAADATVGDKTITLPNLSGNVALLTNAAIETIDAAPNELNILDGATLTTTELNKLDGVTASTAEINYLDITTLGVSENSKAVTQSAAGKITIGATNGDQIIDIASHDLVNGGLQLAGTLVTASAAEINKLDGLTATTTELNYVDGVTSAIQTQLDALEPAANKVTKKLSGSTATSYDITHGFGTQHVRTTVLDYGDNGSLATYEQVFVDVKNSTNSNSSNNKITITFGVAPGTSQDYLVLIEKFPAIS